MTRVGTLGNDVTTVQAMIGTGETSTSAVTGTQHVDQQLDENIDYYIIIRCFSRINTTVSREEWTCLAMFRQFLICGCGSKYVHVFSCKCLKEVDMTAALSCAAEVIKKFNTTVP